MGFKLVLAHTLDPSSPFWDIHPIEKYLHPKAHHAEIPVEKKCRFWPPQTHLCHMGANNFWDVNSVRSCQTLSNARHKPLHNILQHLKLAAWLKTCVEISALLVFSVLKAPGKLLEVFPGGIGH